VSRQLTKGERNEARHLLQELSETARLVRNAVEPETGVFVLTAEQWEQQWNQMTLALEVFTAQVRARQ
jgi:hypothetical protein